MFKRIIASLITMFLLINLVACQESKSSRSRKSSDDEDSSNSSGVSNGLFESDEENEKENIKHTGKKLEGTIGMGADFSEGLAFVKINGNKDITYCINKDGYIVFEYNGTIVNMSDRKFINGFVLIQSGQALSEGICDISGNITYPEDVGATKFYDVAFEGKYILAERVTSDYTSATKELGIMDFSFNWIVEPSETLYSTLEDYFQYFKMTSSYSYYYNNYLFCGDDSCYLNLKTGEITNKQPFTTPSSEWSGYDSDNTYRDENNNIMLDLGQHPNIYKLFDFKNGKAGILFYNKEASTYYFTVIDEKGTFAFEPISCGNKRLGEIIYDGKNTIFITAIDSIIAPIAFCYNLNGELISELPEFPDGDSFTAFSDSVIKIYGLYSGDTYYYNPDFTPLF